MKNEIIEIIENNTEYWQSHGEENSCFIIEEKPPFWWRINHRWAEEVAEKIVKLMNDKYLD